MKKEIVKPLAVYLCDPKENVYCRKDSCFLNNEGCFLTRKKEYAVEGTDVFKYAHQTKIIEENDL